MNVVCTTPNLIVDDRRCWTKENKRAHLFDNQAIIYNWFSRLFIAPLNTANIVECQSKIMQDFLSELGSELDDQFLANQIKSKFCSMEAHALECQLTREYVLLFEGVAGPKSIPLYESYYRDPSGRLFQQPYQEMQQIAAELRLEIIESCKEPVDHLALELSALADALQQGNELYCKALVQRLLCWVPNVQSAIEQTLKTSLYLQLVELLLACLSSLARFVTAKYFD